MYNRLRHHPQHLAPSFRWLLMEPPLIAHLLADYGIQQNTEKIKKIIELHRSSIDFVLQDKT